MASHQVKPANRAAEVVMAFSELLTAETLHYMTQLPKSASLRSEQVVVLQQIAKHFSGPVDIDEAVTNSDTPMADALPPSSIENDEPVIVDDDTIQEDTSLQTEPSAVGETSLTASPSVGRRTLVPSTRRRGRPRVSDAPHKSNASSKQWGTILAKETFQLDGSLQRHAQDVDPTPFVGDIRRGTVASGRIEHGQLDRDAEVELVGNGEAPTKTRPTLKSKLNYKDFLDFCTSVSNMPVKSVEERVSRLFLLIRVGEIARQYIGSNWSNEKSLVLKTTTSPELDPVSFEELKKVLRMSDRLMFISECPEFGIGSILWLQHELSSNNLLQRHISKTGEAYDSVIKHVQDRGLVASIEESRADKLADAIRDHLRLEYSVESLVAAVVDPEDGSELGGGAVASVNGGE